MRWPVIWTDDMPDDVGGYAFGPIIKIRPRYRGDEGLFRHELEHVRQWFATLTLHWFLYRIRRYRQWSEVRAYREQMRWDDGQGGRITLDGAARRLARPLYDLGITIDEARQLLM